MRKGPPTRIQHRVIWPRIALFPFHFTIKLLTHHSVNRGLASVLKPLKCVTVDFPKAQHVPNVSTVFGIERYSNLEKPWENTDFFLFSHTRPLLNGSLQCVSLSDLLETGSSRISSHPADLSVNLGNSVMSLATLQLQHVDFAGTQSSP